MKIINVIVWCWQFLLPSFVSIYYMILIWYTICFIYLYIVYITAIVYRFLYFIECLVSNMLRSFHRCIKSYNERPESIFVLVFLVSLRFVWVACFGFEKIFVCYFIFSFAYHRWCLELGPPVSIRTNSFFIRGIRTKGHILIIVYVIL